MIVRLLLAIFTCFAIGGAAVCLLWPRRSGLRWELGTRLFLATGLGLGISSLVLFLSLIVHLSWLEIPLDIGLCVVLTGLAILQSRLSGHRTALGVQKQPREGVDIFLAGALTVALLCGTAGFVVSSLQLPNGAWDGWSIWNLHARFLYRDSAHWTELFSSALWAYKPDYPLLVPGSIARLWEYAGRETLWGPSAIAFVFTLGIVGLAVSALGSLCSRNQGLLAGTLLLCTPAFVSQGAGQCADIPVAFFYLAALVCVCLYERVGVPGLLTLAGAMAGLAAWTKNEGTLFIIVLLLTRLLVIPRKGFNIYFRELGRLVVGLVPVLVVVLYFKLRLVPANDMVANQSVNAFVSRVVTLSRYVIISKAFVKQGWSFGSWTVSLLPVMVLYLLLYRRKAGREPRPGTYGALAAVVLMVCGYFGVYVLTPHGVAWQLQTSLDRVMMQLWPAAVFIFFALTRSIEDAATEVRPVAIASAGGRAR